MSENLHDWVGYERTLHKLRFHQLVDECSRRGYQPKNQLIRGLLKHLGADDRYWANPLLTHISLDALGDALERTDPKGRDGEIVYNAARNWFEQEIQGILVQRLESPPRSGADLPMYLAPQDLESYLRVNGWVVIREDNRRSIWSRQGHGDVFVPKRDGPDWPSLLELALPQIARAEGKDVGDLQQEIQGILVQRLELPPKDAS